MAAVAAAPVSLPGPSSLRGKPTSNRSSVEPKKEKEGSVPRSVKEESKDNVKNETNSPSKDPKPPSSHPLRPPAKPISIAKSKFDLEPNPFEQSFRESHGSEEDINESKTPPRGGDATAIKHNALPPLSSLTSPAAADPSQFPWLANQSLRTGPLSPAMLAGPQGGHANGAAKHGEDHGGFDSTTFRTGFTPGTGSGFTPGYSSLMGNAGFNTLPLPSPNTAAFLNMVTDTTPMEGDQSQNGSDQPSNNIQQHNQHNQQQNHPPSAIPPHMQGLGHIQHHPDMPPQDTITPNTLSALTGVVNDMNRNNSNGSQQQQQQSQMHGQGHHLPHHNGNPGQNGAYYNQHMQAGYMPNMHVDFAQQSANAASQAANGLFLLSQAHQELSKRDDGSVIQPGQGGQPGMHPGNRGPQQQQMQQPQLQGNYHNLQGMPQPHLPGPPPPPQPVGNNKKAGTFIQHQIPGQKNGINPTGQKRKSDASDVKPGTASKKKKGGSDAGQNKKGESTSPNMFGMGDDDDDDSDDGEGKSGKGETEEDKRKNFLERNRQAALKCRQRKKAWLNELQTKVEQLQMENDRLNQTVAGLHDEVGRLTGILMQHRDCGIGIPQYGRPQMR